VDMTRASIAPMSFRRLPCLSVLTRPPIAAMDRKPQRFSPKNNRWARLNHGRPGLSHGSVKLTVRRRVLDKYYLYQDLINKCRVRIRAGDRGHCNDGRG
jgi:hypothetical protein